MDEDGTVIDEQEQFAELASNEFLLQQLRGLLDTGAREMLEELPDGIHSGLARDGEKGMFFYFTAPGLTGEGRRHFWRYYDIGRDRVVDEPIPHRQSDLLLNGYATRYGRLRCLLYPGQGNWRHSWLCP